jgi:hypothetical protein
MIYYDAYGRSFFRDHESSEARVPPPASQDQLLSSMLLVTGVLRDSPFDMGKIFEERRSLEAHLDQLSRIPREPTLAAFQQWAAGRPVLPALGERSYWTMCGLKCVRLKPSIYRWLTAQPQHRTLGEMVKSLDASQASKVLAYFQQLAELGLVVLVPPAEAEAAPVADRASRMRVPLHSNLALGLGLEP